MPASSLHSLSGAMITSMCALLFLVLSSASPIIIDPSCTIKTTDSITDLVRDNRTLRVVVPWKIGFKQFVQFRPDSCLVSGFSIQVFLTALYRMGGDAPRFEFILHGNGTITPPYDELVKLVAHGTVDMAVADLTITSDRMEWVDFTVPYLPSTLVMVTPFRYGSAGTLWDFLKPFSWELWLTLLGSFVATGIAFYLLEDRNPDFHMTTKPIENIHTIKHFTHKSDGSNHISSPIPPPYHDATLQTTNGDINVVASYSDPSSFHCQGPPIYDEASHRRRIMNAYWFSSLCVFAAQQESVRTHLGRIVTVVWLFVMLIFSSSYTASMASLMSAQKSYPTIKDFKALVKDENIKVGYHEGSFMKFFMKKLHIDAKRLIDCQSEMDFVQELHDGLKNPNAGVGAVIDEFPYIQILLQSQCDFIINSDVLHLPSFGGFGFAFTKDSPWIHNFSQSILAMAQDGTLENIKNGWRISGGDDGGDHCNTQPSHLRLKSFGGLLSLLALVYIISILWHLLRRAVHNTYSEQGINLCTWPNITNLIYMCNIQDGSITGQGTGGEGGGASFNGSIGRRSNRVVSDETSSTP